MNNAEAAALLKSKLALDTEPIALACEDSPPAGVTVYAGAKPSACSFWREAEHDLFFAPAESHFNCPVGAMVLGFDLPPGVAAELTALVGTMTKCGYVGAGEPGAIPTRTKKGAKGVLYGPLARFPISPEAVLLWLVPAQAMIVSEAVGGAVWGRNAAVLGRPACAAIPQALGTNRSALSLGCTGMRTFTALAADRLLAVVPGTLIEQFASDVARLSAINDDMAAFYRQRAAALAP
jgi:uncharacterized protein (DUF169 family)